MTALHQRNLIGCVVCKAQKKKKKKNAAPEHGHKCGLKIGEVWDLCEE